MRKIAIVHCATNEHVTTLATAIAKGVKGTGATCDIYYVPGEHVTEDYPTIDRDELKDYDGILFGAPSRFGIMSGQMQTFLDSASKKWENGALFGKPVAMFTSNIGDGQETVGSAMVTFFAKMGMLFVPLGSTPHHKSHGGSPYGPGSVTAADDDSPPSSLDLSLCVRHGKRFASIVAKRPTGTTAAESSDNNSIDAEHLHKEVVKKLRTRFRLVVFVYILTITLVAVAIQAEQYKGLIGEGTIFSPGKGKISADVSEAFDRMESSLLSKSMGKITENIPTEKSEAAQLTTERFRSMRQRFESKSLS